MAQVEKRQATTPAPLEWEYAPAPEARDIVQLRERYGLFVGGEEVEPRSGSGSSPSRRPRRRSCSSSRRQGPRTSTSR